MAESTLRTLLSGGGLGPHTVDFARALAMSMMQLHERGIRLGALDPDLILVDKSGTVQLLPPTGLGFAWSPPESTDRGDSGILGDSYLWGAAVCFAADPSVRGRASSTSINSEPLRALVDSALSGDPRLRPTMPEIIAALDSPPGPSKHGSHVRSGLLWSAAAVAAAALASVGLVWWLLHSAPSDTAPDPSPSPTVTVKVTVDPPQEWEGVPSAAPQASTSSRPSVRPSPDTQGAPTRPGGSAVAAPSGTSFFESNGGDVRCAYFPEGTAGQVIACIDDRTDTLVRLNAGMIRVTEVTESQSLQVPRVGVLVDDQSPVRTYGTRTNGRPLFECWGEGAGVTCIDKAEGSWFIMLPGGLRTSE